MNHLNKFANVVHVKGINPVIIYDYMRITMHLTHNAHLKGTQNACLFAFYVNIKSTYDHTKRKIDLNRYIRAVSCH